MKQIRKQHKHKYRHMGGGTLLIGNSRFPSDDDYECRCKSGFITKSTEDKHFDLPDYYYYIPKDSKTLRITKRFTKKTNPWRDDK